MKLTRKLLCLALAALMVFSVCGALMVSAATTFRVDSGDGSGVVYNGDTYNSINVHTLAFDTDDYVVIPFSAYSGGTYTLNGQFSQAVRWGYDVVGVINGDFFSMTNGYLNDYIVSNGEVIIGDTGTHGSMTCIMPDGSIETVTSSRLNFATYFNGMEVPGGISYINRRPNRSAADGWTDALYYYDFTAASDKCPVAGVAVICKKLNGTVLAIGSTMEAQVVSVEERSNANGITLAKDEFLLYVRSSSPLATTMKALAAGDSVTVSASETVAASIDVTSNATSILANIGYLVKDGSNFAATDAFNSIDPHGNKYKAQWTAFGTKADGSWMFFTSEGASGSVGLTQAQVAEYLLSQGCTNVIRLDGGGSVAMYLSNTGDGKEGYMENHGRNVPDCLMVVKRSSAALQPSDEAKSALKDLIAEAQDSTNENAKAALEYAQGILDNEKSVSGDYTKAIMRLQEALNNKGALGNMLAVAAGASFSDYSEYVLTRLREAYTAASEVFGNPDATADEVAIATAQLVKWVNAKGEYSTSDATYPTMTTDGNFKLLKFNSTIAEGDITLFTPGTSIEQKSANLKWAGAVLLRKNAHGSYVVEKVVNGAAVGSDTYVPDQLGFTVVPDDCLVLGAHGAVNNTAVRTAAVVGTIFTPHGIDIEKQVIGVGAYFSFETATGDGHTFDWKVTKAPTCHAKGSEILTCVYCGETSGSARTIDELDHVFKDGKCLLCGDVQATNIALGKDYTIGYGTNNATYNANLTDGNASTGLSYKPDEWFGFVASNTQNNVGTATIDLGDDYVIDYASVHTYFGKTGDGVVTPALMKVEVSSDGTNYTALGAEVTYANPEQGPGFTTEWVNFAGENSVTGRYVKLTVVIQGAFAFINEIEVYGVPVKEEEPDDPGEDDPKGPTITVVVDEEIDVDGVLDDTGYIEADWVDNGIWQGTEAERPAEDISGKYTVRTDEENIYIALEIDGTIAPNTLETYDPASFVQKSATNIRVWLKKDVPSRTFFDLQYNGSEFTLANWNTNHAATNNVSFVFNYEDGKLVAEICVPMADIGIEDSFYLLITYSDTFSNGYNAIHFTTAKTLNNPAGGANANYWDVENTYSYAYYTVSEIELGEIEIEVPCDHKNVIRTIVDPTCTESGYAKIVCDHCDEEIFYVELPALGHDYKDGVCTRCGAEEPKDTDPDDPNKDPVDPTPTGKIGDVDENGVVDANDYIALKRYILGTFDLSEEALALADIDGNGDVDANDYIMLRRAILGLFTIGESAE